MAFQKVVLRLHGTTEAVTRVAVAVNTGTGCEEAPQDSGLQGGAVALASERQY